MEHSKRVCELNSLSICCLYTYIDILCSSPRNCSMVNIHTGHLKMFLKIKITNGLKNSNELQWGAIRDLLKKITTHDLKTIQNTIATA